MEIEFAYELSRKVAIHRQIVLIATTLNLNLVPTEFPLSLELHRVIWSSSDQAELWTLRKRLSLYVALSVPYVSLSRLTRLARMARSL